MKKINLSNEQIRTISDLLFMFGQGLIVGLTIDLYHTAQHNAKMAYMEGMIDMAKGVMENTEKEEKDKESEKDI